MATDRLREALGHVHLALAPPEGDAQLLARFVACREEAAFAALVRRHGPMVLGVCRRVLRHAEDAADAFQATFLVLARKAGAVLEGHAVGSWLYAVAYRTARHARESRQRRRARERQVDVMPHPAVHPPEAQDWRPLLDDELSRLPAKYRGPVVLCDLQGQSHREAARLLGLAAGTLARRLAAGRRLLAERLSRRGVALSGGALAAALAQGAASAPAGASLVAATARAAVCVAGGDLAAVAAPVAALTRGVLRAMFLTKLKIVVGVALVLALGAGGVAYRPAGAQTFQPPTRTQGKPRSELEALRRENELLKLNLEVVLEKVRAQEDELRALRGKLSGQTPAGTFTPDLGFPINRANGLLNPNLPRGATREKAENRAPTADMADRIEAALKRSLDAKEGPARQRALEELREALRSLREQPRQPGFTPPAGGVRP